MSNAPASDILSEIIAHKRREVAELKKRHRLEQLGIKASPLKDGGAFRAALTRPGMSLIAEIKKASPSAGLIREDFHPAALAREYAKAGAAAMIIDGTQVVVVSRDREDEVCLSAEELAELEAGIAEADPPAPTINNASLPR